MAEAEIQTLHEAVEAGQIDDVMKSLRNGASVNEKSEEGDSALHLAAWEIHHLCSDFYLEYLG
jgi:ankyrin repeat protein